MTNDGDIIINRHDACRNQHEKEYKVTVDKEITPEFIEKMGTYQRQGERFWML